MAAALTTVFRVADWASGLRVTGNRSEGRYHRPGEIVQYFTLHPLGAWAEYLRREQPSLVQLGSFRHRLWAARVDLSNAVRIEWGNARRHGIRPEQLVGEDYGPCQALAGRLRTTGAPALVVPNAALPGTRSVVLFGPRVQVPYTAQPLDDIDVPCAVVAEDATVPIDLVHAVRYGSTPHSELSSWRARREFVFFEPLPAS